MGFTKVEQSISKQLLNGEGEHIVTYVIRMGGMGKTTITIRYMTTMKSSAIFSAKFGTLLARN